MEKSREVRQSLRFSNFGNCRGREIRSSSFSLHLTLNNVMPFLNNIFLFEKVRNFHTSRCLLNSENVFYFV